MKRSLRLLALLALLALPWAVSAQTDSLTICNGTANHEYVPFYGFYADDDQHNQMIYPSDSLTAMNGSAITRMVFYIDPAGDNGSNTAADRMGTWLVSLGETTSTTLSGLDNSTALTEVYEGYFDCSTGTLTLEFSSPYIYGGGNLLVDLQHSAANWNRWYFLGVTATGASYCYDSQRDFLPKVQFTYGAAPSCLRVQQLTATDILSDGMTINWVDTINSTTTYTLRYWPANATASDTNEVTNLTGTSYVLTNLEANTYYYFSILPDCTDGTVMPRTASFKTDCENGSCLITVNAVDTYGDGWNGNAINVYQAGALAGSATIASGNSATVQIPVCKGDSVQVTFTLGSYPQEMSGTVVDGGGATIFAIEGMDNRTDGAVLAEVANACPDCIAPTNLAAAVDEDGDFVFSWTGSASAYMVYVNDSLYSEEVSDNSYVLNGLASSSSYRLGVASLCDDDTSAVSWVNIFTPCAAITELPWTENFNTLSTGYDVAFHPCMTKGNNAGVNYPYVYNSSMYSIPSNFLYFYTSIYSGPSMGDVVREWVVLPTLGEDVDMNTLELSFTGYPCYTGSNYGHSLLVGVIDSAAYADSMAIDTIATFVISETETKYVSFANYTGTGKNIILMHWLDDDHAYAYVGIDDLDLHLLPQCDRPDSLTLTAASSTSLTLGWWSSEDVTDFLVEYRPAGTVTYSSATASANSITLDNLTPNTVYDVRLRSVCGSDYSTAITGQFRTACANVTTYPYTEDFETNSRTCWTAYSYDNSSSSDWTLTTYTVHSPSNAFNSSYSSGSGTDWLISPAFEIPADMEAARLSWYIAGGVYFDEVPRYAVKVSTTSSVDTTAFTTLLEENRDDYDDNTYSYVFEKRSVSLAQYAGQTVYVAFVRHARDDNGLYLDDITIEQAQEPEAAIVGSATPLIGVAQTYAARLDGGLEAGLTWNWYSARANANTATMTTVSADTITMLYATPGVDTLRLIATNTFGADTVWMVVDPLDITYTSLPYSTGFEPADDCSWTISNGPNGWYIDSVVSASGNYSLYVSADSGATNGYNNGSMSNSYAYKAFNFDTPGQYVMSLDWKGVGESCCDYVQVYLVPVNDSSMVGSSDYFSAPSSWRSIGSRMNQSADWQNASVTFNINNPGVYYVCIFWRNDGSVGSNPAGAVDNVMLMPITCPAPVALTFDSISSVGATFHWTATGTETSWQVRVGNLAPVTVTDTFYTVSGLTPATNYSVSVRGICGAGDTSLVLGGSFWTECVAFSVPYYFHHVAGNGLNVCWSDVVTANVQPSTTWGQSANYSGEYIYSYATYGNSIANDYLISPAIQIPATGDLSSLRLVLQMAGVPSTGYTNSLAACQVLVSPTGADSVAAFTDTLATDTLNSNSFAYYRYPLASYAGQTIRFAVRNMSKMYGQLALYDAAVRFVSHPMYTVYGSTIALTGDTNSYTAMYEEGDTATMTLSWTSTMAAAGLATIVNANTDSMSIIYNEAGVDSITFIATNSYGADTTAFHVTVYSCGTINQFPYVENFNVENPCWTKVYGDNDPSVNTMGVTTEFTSSLGTAYEGTGAFRFSSFSNSSDYHQYLISPQLEGSNMVMSYAAAVYGASDSLWVGYSTTGNDTADFTWTKLSLSNTAWTELTDTLPDGTHYVAFHYWGSYAYYAYLDNLVIEGVGANCPDPVISLANTVVGENEITLSYSGEASSYEVAYVEGSQWNAPASGTAVSDTFYTFTGLAANTQYTVGVRAVCDGGMVSAWSYVTLTTDMHPCFVPTNVTMSNVTYSSATLSWTPGENETAWEVRLYCASPLDSALYQVSDTTLAVDGLLVGASYAVSVRALCTNDYYSDWSEPVMLNTLVCAVPTSVSAGNVTATGATITWQGTAATYVVNYGTQGINQGEGHLDTVQGTSYAISGLAPQTPYDVYVSSICADGVSSDWSTVAQFTTTQVGIDDVNANANISLYPNPASHMVTISGIEGTATVTVIDLNGRQNGQWQVENGELTIDVSTMAKGAYFVRIAGESTVAVRKLVVK